MRSELLERVVEVPDKKGRGALFKEVVGIGSRRFRKALEHVVKHWARTASAGGIFVTSVFSPVDSPIKSVRAESNQNQQQSLTFEVEYGDGYYINPPEESTFAANADECIKQPVNDLIWLGGEGCFGKLNILLVAQNGSNLNMLTEIKEDLTSIDPMKEIIGDANVYGLLNAESLGCNQVDTCDWNAVNRLIDRVVATGMIPHETMVVIRSNDENWGTGFNPLPLPSHLSKPDIYSPSVIIRSADTRGRREGDAGTVVHEFLHQFAGFYHEGNDIMQRVCNCINEQHAQFLRSLKPLIPYNYGTPKNEIKIGGVSSLVAQSLAQTPDISLAAVVFTPKGTTQLYSEVRPFNDDGPGVFDYIGDQSHIHAWSEIGKKIPAPKMGEGPYILLPDMTYTWKVRSSGLAVPLSKDDPRWTTVEGWPGVFFPNPAAEIKIHTSKRFSDGITAVSPKIGEVINTSNPTLVWTNRDPDVFYYEVQASRDSTFNTDPQTATASVIWELRHGGVTNPLNSYTVPGSARLDLGTEYYWRVRPRVQGDGTPVAWSETFRFSTPATLKGVVSTKQFLEDLNRVKMQERALNRSRDEHWAWVEREVSTKTKIPLFDDHGEIITWINHSDNIPFEAYKREEEPLSLAA